MARHKRYSTPSPTGEGRRLTFDWNSFLDFASKAPATPSSPSRVNHGGWHGGLDFDQTLALAHAGWSEGAEKAKTIANPTFDKLSSLIERETITYDVEGSGLDVGRYLEGEPECWQQWQTEIAEGHGTRVIRICFNATASAGVNSEIIMAKGAVIAALVELLEYAGRRVELTLAYATHGRNTTDQSLIRIKDADQPLDMPRVAFAIAHTGMFRRLAFAMLETGPVYKQGGSLGGPAAIDNPQAFDLYIAHSQYPDVQWTNTQAAQAYIITELEKQGITLQKETEKP